MNLVINNRTMRQPSARAETVSIMANLLLNHKNNHPSIRPLLEHEKTLRALAVLDPSPDVFTFHDSST